MTNVSSGSKRPHEGPEHYRDRDKRQRSDTRDVKDRKDTHSSPSRRRSPDRRSNGRERDREYEKDRERRPHSRDRRDDRDRRDRERDRDRDRRRDHDRDRDRRPSRRDDDRDRERRRTPVPLSTHRPRTPPRKQHESDREEGEISPHPSRDRTPPTTSMSKHTEPIASTPAPTAPPEPEPELELSTSPIPVELTLAARRAKRQEILAKYTGVSSVATSAASPGPGLTTSSAVQPPPPAQPHASDLAPSRLHSVQNGERDGQDGERGSPSASPTEGMFELAKGDGEEAGTHQRDGEQMISAADYDPSLDRREDEHRRVNGTIGTRPEVEMVEEEVEELEDDDDVDDMFAVGTTEKKKRKIKKVKKLAVPALITTTLDQASDPEGYYQTILGEQLDGGRYQVFALLGKGMFANVVRARVLQSDDGDVGREVAIKIIRSQESMYKAGLKEVQILNKLRQADPEDKKHLVKLERSFEHRGHLCLVFESLSMNLRDVVKKFGKDVGLNIRAVRAYAHQLFLAMSLLRKCNVMHADIKPDNILVNEQKTLLKLCDLGSASDASENEITPYLVSRFYRAPEIILGYPYDPALDIWSIGCTLYELYTGKILLPGRSNNQMLLLMMELRGRFNTKIIKKARFGSNYFDEMGVFESIERDRLTGGDVVKKVQITRPTRDLRARLLPAAAAQAQMKDDERKMLLGFVDLLEKCLALDPAKRITPREALAHPFIRG